MVYEVFNLYDPSGHQLAMVVDGQVTYLKEGYILEKHRIYKSLRDQMIKSYEKRKGARNQTEVEEIFGKKEKH